MNAFVNNLDSNLILTTETLGVPGYDSRDSLDPHDSKAMSSPTEARLDAILRATPDSIITIASDGLIVTLNRATERMFGYGVDELVGRNIKVLMPEPFRGEHDDYLHRYLETGTRHILDQAREVVAQRKDGSSFPAQLIVSEILEHGQRRFLGIVRDITEQKKTKSGYLQKTSDLHAVFEGLPDCFFRIARDGTILDYHGGSTARFHATTDLYLGNKLPNILAPEIATQYQTAIDNVHRLHEPAAFEYVVQTNTGATLYETRVIPSLHQNLIVIVRDLTHHLAPTPQSMQYNTLATFLPVGIFRSDTSGNFVYVNDHWCGVADLAAHNALGEGWIDALHPDDRDRIGDLWHTCVHEGLAFNAEFRFQHADSVMAWVYGQAVPERDDNGEITGYIGAVTDITDRIKMDEALRRLAVELEMRVEERTADVRAKNRYLQESINKQKRVERELRAERNFISTVLETAGALVVVCDNAGHIQQLNRRCLTTSGFTLDEMRGKLLWDVFIPAAEVDETKSRFQRLLAGEGPLEFESPWQTRDGRQRLISWTNTTISDADGHVTNVICTGVDITEQRHAEEEARQHHADLAHVSRLCTMGEMAAGLAHELNQPLAAIVSYTQGCVRRIAGGASDPHELLEAMRQVTKQAQRAGEIIKHLRNFVSKGEPQRTNVHPNVMVKEVLNIAKVDVRKYQSNVQLRLADPLPIVNVDQIQIEQVILNLVRNGLEAMSNTEANAREMTIRTSLSNNREVLYSISDTGEGLPPGLDPERVFDAFFTTKKEGMGMGLAISRSIIEAHGGKLWATRNPDRGTTFQFTLPT